MDSSSSGVILGHSNSGTTDGTELYVNVSIDYSTGQSFMTLSSTTKIKVSSMKMEYLKTLSRLLLEEDK